MADERFPRVTISGRTPAELGASHGSQLKVRVRKNVAFYQGWFLRLGLTERQLRETANLFKASLRRFRNGRYAEEIEAIAAAAGLPHRRHRARRPAVPKEKEEKEG